jgi:ATP-dependent Zn protease
MPQSTSRQRVCDAYHEAGHAIVGHLLGRVIKEVSIAPSSTIHAEVNTALGYCQFDPDAEDAHRIEQWGHASNNSQTIAILLAGASAYVNLCHERWWDVGAQRDGCGYDVQQAEFLSA